MLWNKLFRVLKFDSNSLRVFNDFVLQGRCSHISGKWQSLGGGLYMLFAELYGWTERVVVNPLGIN